VLRRRKFFQGRRIRGAEVKDLSWFDSSGHEMTDEDWNSGITRSLGVRLAGDAMDETTERGEPVVDDMLLLLLNAHHEPVPFMLPPSGHGRYWTVVCDTAIPRPSRRRQRVGAVYPLQGRSLVVLRANRSNGG
jgi:glycogen operon protein